MSRLIFCVLTLSFLSSSAMAQGDAMIELYGEGVHRYFAGDYAGADELLTQVVDGGSVDPRVHYFRGLTRELLEGDGQADYALGAKLEAEGNLSVDVGMALARIQGITRTKIEELRRAARVTALQHRIELERAQMSAPTPPVQEPPPPTETEPPADSDAPDLLSEGGLRSEETTPDPVQPAAEATPDESANPFGDDPAPVPDAPATTEPAEVDNPFGTDDSNPFGTPGSDSGADDDNPFDTGDSGTDSGSPF